MTSSTSPRDPVFRAVQHLRTVPDPGWDAIAGRVLAAVRATARPGVRPVAAQMPPEHSGPGRLYVSDHVLRSTLAVELRRRFLCAPTDITFVVDDQTAVLRQVHIDVTGSYGTSLRELAAEIRSATLDVIAELLGDVTDGPIDVTIADVVTGDPFDA